MRREMMKRGICVMVLGILTACGTLWAGGNGEVLTPETTGDGFKRIEVEDSEVSWKIDGGSVMFRISAPTEGWVAIGFEPSRYMQDANIIIGYVENGEVFISDQFGTSAFAHKKDEEIGGTQDISDVGGSESGGRTTLEFTLPLDSGDEFDRPLEEGKTITIIMAHAKDGEDNFKTKHAKRGSIRVPF
jgi:hypothetical protein